MPGQMGVTETTEKPNGLDRNDLTPFVALTEKRQKATENRDGFLFSRHDKAREG